MIKNYLTIALRVLKRDRLFSIINILGLSAGLATVFFIFLWVSDELAYDRFHQHNKDIYYVYEYQQFSENQKSFAPSTPGPLAPVLQERFGEIEQAVRVTWGTFNFQLDEQLSRENRVYFTDQNFFDVFSFPVLKGRTDALLAEPGTIVLTRQLAEKYFGTDWEQREDVLGQFIKLDNRWNVKVSGVVENPPAQSTLQFKALVPYQLLAERSGQWVSTDWGSHFVRTYVKLAPGADAENVAASIKNLVKTQMSTSVAELYLMPLADVHLSALNGKTDPKTYLRIFSAAAIVILLIACINFTNLATARAMKRAREVGVRKSVGAAKVQLMTQYLMESLVLAAVSSVVAALLAVLLLPWFNQAAGKELAVTDIDGWFIYRMLAIVGITGMVAGAYPAFYLSSFKPVEVLKGAVKLKGGLFRKVLVVAQFTLSTVLILATVVVNSQLSYMKNKDLGYRMENVVYLEMKGAASGSYRELQAEAAAYPDILSLTVSDQVPSSGGNSTSNVDWNGKDPEIRTNVSFLNTGYDMLETMGMELVAGRAHSRDFSTDSMNYLINEAMAANIGKSPEAVVGERFRLWQNDGKIIGVVKNYHYEKMDNEIGPLVISLSPRRAGYLLARISGPDLENSLANLQEVWSKAVPNQPFEYSFLDDDFNRIYEKERQVNRLFTSFSVVAILISCIGLFGLSSFVAAQRRKEISLRKVLGAGIPQIVVSFSGTFISWVVVANIIGLPAGYLLMEQWLQGYAYRIALNPMMLLAVLLITLGITLTTILYQAMKSASANPVDELRHE